LDYEKHTVDMSMPGYVSAVLHQHPEPERPQHFPYKQHPMNHGTKVQFFMPEDLSVPLTAEQKATLQQVVGCLLYHARAVDPTILVALSTLSSAHIQGTETTTDAIVQLINYCATHPDAEVRFHASYMVLHVSSDVSYLSEPYVRSCTGGHFYLMRYI
jgi:hypothetical protein